MRASGLALLLGALPGCQNITGNMPVSQVRIIDASPDAPALDTYQGGVGPTGSALAYNLGFGTVTSYIPIAPGVLTLSAATAGSKQQLTTAKGTFAASAQYTVLIGDIAAGLTETVLTDQSTPAPSGQISIRVLDQATRFATPLDVYFVPAGTSISAVSALRTNVSFGHNSGYINLPGGTYSLVLMPAGTVPGAGTVPVYTGAKVGYTEGVARTLVVLDQRGLDQRELDGRETAGPALQVITAEDYDPPILTN